MNLKKPVCHVKIMKNKQLLFSGPVKSRGHVKFDGHMLTLQKVKYNAAFRIIKDPGLLWILLSFAFMITGLIWRMIFCKNEVALVKNNGTFFLYTRSDYYPVTFMEKCSKVFAVKNL